MSQDVTSPLTTVVTVSWQALAGSGSRSDTGTVSTVISILFDFSFIERKIPQVVSPITGSFHKCHLLDLFFRPQTGASIASKQTSSLSAEGVPGAQLGKRTLFVSCAAAFMRWYVCAHLSRMHGSVVTFSLSGSRLDRPLCFRVRANDSRVTRLPQMQFNTTSSEMYSRDKEAYERQKSP